MRSKFHIAMLVCCAVILCAASALATWKDSSSHFSCSGYSGGEKINQKGAKTLSVPEGMDTCSYLQGFENSGNFTEEQYHEVYDSLRLYIELCGKKDCRVWEAFQSITAAVQAMSNDSTRFDRYRVWLDSVLYLYPECPEYFCVAMGSIQRTYQYGKYKEIGGFAVVKYLREHHPECWDSASEVSYKKNIQWLISNGYDTSKVPPLDSIGLGIVLQHDASMGVSMPSGLSSIKDISLQPNPALESVTASYTLNSQSFVILSLFDALGKTVWEQTGRTEPQGEHSVSIDLHTLPSGTYYLRIRTLGETKTVTLVHEK